MIIDLNLNNKQVLVVGGGVESARKVEALLTQQCKIIVVAEKVEESIKKHANDDKIVLELRRIKDVKFIEKYKQLILILATTDNRELNRKIVLFGKSYGCYVYAADDPEVSDFSHPSIINVKNVIQVAISTGGKSPLMGKKLREKIEPLINDVIGKLTLNQISLQGQLRTELQKIISTPAQRKEFLVELMNDGEINRILEGDDIANARKAAYKLLEKYIS